MEAIWDKLLTSGKRMYGIAVDDAHHFKGEFARGRSNPGRGWICVKANSLNAKEIMMNLEEGLFYASTGVILQDVVVTPQSLEILVKPDSDFKYVIEFVGDGGKLLKRVEDMRGRFELDRKLAYVRARVKDSGGAVAWVQPLFVKSR